MNEEPEFAKEVQTLAHEIHQEINIGKMFKMCLVEKLNRIMPLARMHQ